MRRVEVNEGEGKECVSARLPLGRDGRMYVVEVCACLQVRVFVRARGFL